MSTKRKSLIAGNWKMYKTPGESVEFVKSLIENTKEYNDRDILVCPPFTSLPVVSEILLKNSSIKMGAQNVYFEDEGAFTGEISPVMLKDIGVEYVICGHSERRKIFGETNEIVNKKMKILLEYQMIPILCVGEKIEERKSGRTFDVIRTQVENCLAGLEGQHQVVIAYEPVWAIGTGLTATPEQAEEVHLFIRKMIEDLYGQETEKAIRILYGGSVKPDNIDLLMRQKDIDGVLVGGASLSIESFVRIIEYR